MHVSVSAGEVFYISSVGVKDVYSSGVYDKVLCRIEYINDV